MFQTRATLAVAEGQVERSEEDVGRDAEPEEDDGQWQPRRASLRCAELEGRHGRRDRARKQRGSAEEAGQTALEPLLGHEGDTASLPTDGSLGADGQKARA